MLKNSKINRFWVSGVATIIILILAVVAIQIMATSTEQKIPLAEKLRVDAMVEQLITAERGDILIMKSSHRVECVITNLGGHHVHSTFSLAADSTTRSTWLLASQIERIVKKDDADYAETAVKFLQQ